LAGVYNFSTATLQDGSQVNGTAADLAGDDATGALSQAISALNSSSSHPLPFAPVAGIYENWNQFALSNMAVFASVILPFDPLAQSFTAPGWQALFHGAPNDAIVTVNSQDDGLNDRGSI
jgi:hypothetical protein